MLLVRPTCRGRGDGDAAGGGGLTTAGVRHDDRLLALARLPRLSTLSRSWWPRPSRSSPSCSVSWHTSSSNEGRLGPATVERALPLCAGEAESRAATRESRFSLGPSAGLGEDEDSGPPNMLSGRRASGECSSSLAIVCGGVGGLDVGDVWSGPRSTVSG